MYVCICMYIYVYLKPKHSSNPAEKQASNPHLTALRHSYASSAHPAHLHTCRKPVRSFEARPSEPHPSLSSSYHYIYYTYCTYYIYYIYYIHCIQYFFIKGMQSVQSMQKHKRAPQNHGSTAQVRLPALHTLHHPNPHSMLAQIRLNARQSSISSISVC